nr:hypothetical protein Iba_chr08aCG14680 [Ipomoea batatas]
MEERNRRAVDGVIVRVAIRFRAHRPEDLGIHRRRIGRRRSVRAGETILQGLECIARTSARSADFDSQLREAFLVQVIATTRGRAVTRPATHTHHGEIEPVHQADVIIVL